jgi:hypothetical protein
MWQPGKPSTNENEYFAKRDAEWLREQRALLNQERELRKQTEHHLQCPRCHGEMKERAHHHLRIDVCSICHGVWLDAGELEMVLHLPRAELLHVVNELEAGRQP